MRKTCFLHTKEKKNNNLLSSLEKRGAQKKKKTNNNSISFWNIFLILYLLSEFSLIPAIIKSDAIYAIVPLNFAWTGTKRQCSISNYIFRKYHSNAKNKHFS